MPEIGLNSRSGAAIIDITHRLGEVNPIADRAVVLRDGAMSGTLAREELTHDAMVRLMVGRELSERATASTHAAEHASHDDGREGFSVDALRTRRYPQHAVSFAVERGEILSVAGLVGAGRSEVAAAIVGIDARLGGTLRFDGVPLTIDAPRDAMTARTPITLNDGTDHFFL